MKIYNSLSQLIGNTPLLKANRYMQNEGLCANLFAKLEYFNPAGSVKDRVAAFMIEDAESKGLLHPDSVIVEPTSGNTGIGLALVAILRGYKVILTMPETMSLERRQLLKAYGAELVLTDGKAGMTGAVAKAKEIADSIPHSFIPDQFGNSANPEAHRRTTAPEIWNDTDGKVDIFVAGVGTGGTLTGVGSYLKERNPDVKIVAVEPFNSAVLSGKPAGSHGLQGIGAGFIPKTLDRNVIDKIYTVTEQQAYSAGKRFTACEGVLTGISSGAALYAATLLAKNEQNTGKNIVVVLPDSGEKYLSTPMYS